MNELYYMAPSLKIFNEVKQKSIEIWQTYDDSHGYATEKINRIKDVPNYKDNMMWIIAMFDIHNQSLLAGKLSDKAKKAISDRLKSIGEEFHYNIFTIYP